MSGGLLRLAENPQRDFPGAHLTIEVVSDLFDNISSERGRLNELFRREIFDAFSKSDEYGMIFTYMWALDQQSDWDYIADVEKMFTNRLLHKASKRNIAKSEERFRSIEEKDRLNSYDGEMPMENYIKIHNDDLEPDAVADMIRERFCL